MVQRTTTIDDPDLVDLLEGIDAGEVALPNFQRDFDWTDSDVRALLATVLNGWPMGSLLLIEGNAETREFYDPRPFEYAPPLSSNPATIVLDGQQRLTSLYTALYDRSDSVHAVALGSGSAWNDIDSLDSSIRTFKRIVWQRHYSTPAAQADARLLPVSSLRSASKFFDWRDTASGGDQTVIDELTNLYRDHLSGLYRYRMPALSITRDTHPAAVARIFERVNKTGQRLGAFDLMVAKSFTPDFNLRVKWDETREQFPELGRFYGDDGLAPLQVIALRVLDDVRASSVLRLTPSVIHDYWDRAAASLAGAVRFAMGHLGVFTRDWLPYNSLMVVLAAYLWADEAPSSEIRNIKRWYWRSCLTARYAVGSNTVAVSDFKRLSAGKFADEDPIVLDWTIFREATKQSAGALHRAWLCALAASSGERGDDLEASTPLARSLISRRSGNYDDVAPHLLSLGFALFTDDHVMLSDQFLPPAATADEEAMHDLAYREAVFRERFSRAGEFIAAECDQEVRIVDNLAEGLDGRGD